jgi:hypothetical protein
MGALGLRDNNAPDFSKKPLEKYLQILNLLFFWSRKPFAVG